MVRENDSDPMLEKSLKVVVVDDEPLARRRLISLLQECDCEVVHEFEDGQSLLDWIHGRPDIDALFLDIQMPEINGLELLAEIPHPPAVIFVTAHREYAVMAFEMSAIDYILKPVFPERVAKAVEKIRKRQVQRLSNELMQKAMAIGPQRFPVKSDQGRIYLELKRVTHFELENDVVWAWCGGKRFRTHWSTLGQVEEEFPISELVRIQRNTLLRPDSVTGFQPLLAGRIKVRVWEGMELEVSRTTTPGLKKYLGLV